jgi:hypothetical protein
MDTPSKSAACAADKGANATAAKIKVRTMEPFPLPYDIVCAVFHFVNGKPSSVESDYIINFTTLAISNLVAQVRARGRPTDEVLNGPP